MKHDSVRSIGIVLIIVGVAVFLMNYFDWNISWDTIWPLIPIVIGLVFLTRLGREQGIVFPATILIGVGLIFLAQNSGFFPGYNMGDLWPLFPIVVGLAFLMLYIVDRTDAGVLVPACILLGVGAVFLSINISGWVIYIAPSAIIVIGLALIVRSMSPQKEKEPIGRAPFNESSKPKSDSFEDEQEREIPVKYIKDDEKSDTGDGE
ncbi:MAG TPA: DUF5668 domain-containing protein [Caldisericia bacterium]|nr:DUF5668 domain-containing protein [Caldisericia bacterium]HPF48288.1 DUF5668 domain-containing protein [Caldisericia bacterium]HPI83533.1 DUF5668 domain-containing protein [Caldisericia bacterium]HPQ92741.1 DUF5668 domain-containing protein [Caldisericia bacterium]HRV74161.1 DUF5668 domain-containing protein [Caldisericia bacterium]